MLLVEQAIEDAPVIEGLEIVHHSMELSFMAAPHNSLQTFQQPRSRPAFERTTDDHLRLQEHCLSTSDDQRTTKQKFRGKIFHAPMKSVRLERGEEMFVTTLLN